MADDPQSKEPPVLSSSGQVLASIPDHELIRLIGRGSYGEVWLAKSTLGTYRAVKIVYGQKFKNKRPFEREYGGVQKFEPVSRLHEGLVDVLQVGRNDAAGYFYYVMELADDVATGQTIDPEKYSPRTLAQELIKPERLHVSECREIGVAIAFALHFLHGRGLIHRDVKPSNVVFVEGVPKLADVGLVVEIAEAKSYVGTDGFIPPEGPGTVQADIYSLGKVLYEISTGYDRHDYPELPTMLGDPGQEYGLLELNRIILRACRTDPRKRYKTAKAIAGDLLALNSGETVLFQTAKRLIGREKAGFGLLLALGIGLLVLFFSSNKRNVLGSLLGHASIQSAQVSVPAPDGIVSWWSGESNAFDSIGESDGTLVNGASFAPGKVGRAFSFDGIDDHIRIADSPRFRFTNEFTIESWINPSSEGRFQQLISKWDIIKGQNQRSFSSGLTPDGRVYLGVSHDGSDLDVATVFGTNTVPVNEWTHVAATFDGQFLKMYMNGVVHNETEFRKTLFCSTNYLSIGGGVGSAAIGQVNDPFSGLIDEPAIYDRALSAMEVQAIYNAGIAGKRATKSRSAPKTTFEPVSWWRGDNSCDDSAGTNRGVSIGNVRFAPGQLGHAFSLDGSNSLVLVPSNPSLEPAGPFTLQAWINYNNITAQNGGTIVMKGSHTNSFGDWGLSISATRKLEPHVNLNGGWYYFDCNTTLKTGVWYHVAMVYDGGALRGYVNGLEDWKLDVSGTVRTSKEPLQIGAYTLTNSTYGSFFSGCIDEVMLYNRALSAAELQASYVSGKSGQQHAIKLGQLSP